MNPVVVEGDKIADHVSDVTQKGPPRPPPPPMAAMSIKKSAERGKGKCGRAREEQRARWMFANKALAARSAKKVRAFRLRKRVTDNSNICENT